MRDRDRIDERPAVSLTEPPENPGAAVDEKPTRRSLEQVPRMRSARVGPGGGAADDGEFHGRILPN